MTGPGRRLPAVLSSLVLALVTMLVAGCGDDPSPAEEVPALSQHLDEVDAAISEGRYDDARLALEALVDVTARARVEGVLDSEEADEILQAVGRLGKRLPATESGEEESDEKKESDDQPSDE